MDKIYDADFIYKFAEKVSYLIFGPVFRIIPLTPNQITLFNFFVNNLSAVYFFSLGTHLGYLIGLFFCFISAVFDWMDGWVARTKELSSKAGGWLDPATGFIWQHLLVAAIVLGVYNSQEGNYYWLLFGLLMYSGVVIANYLGNLFNDKFDFSFRTSLHDFRKSIYQSKKSTWYDKLVVEILAPTSFLTFFLFTIRYPIMFGAITNKMEVSMVIISITSLIKAVFLFITYFLYLERESRKPLVIIKSLETRERKILNQN